MSDCIRCQHDQAQRDRDARTRREKLAVAQLRAKLAKQGRAPTNREEQDAKKAATAKHEAKLRAETIRAKDKQNRVPPSRRI